MNILYTFAFLTIIYYLFSWKNIVNLTKNKIAQQLKEIEEKPHFFNKNTNLLGYGTNIVRTEKFNQEILGDNTNGLLCLPQFIAGTYSGYYENELLDSKYKIKNN